MDQEEYNLIRRFAKKYLFRKYHNNLLEDCVQYLATNKWKKPNYDLRFGVIDFCREAGLTMERAKTKNRITHQSVEIHDNYATMPEPPDIFGEIEWRLLEKGAPQNMINEAVSLLKDRDYSGAIDCFKRIGYSLPVKYKYQRWTNSEKLGKLSSKIVKYLRENIDVEVDKKPVQKRTKK